MLAQLLRAPPDAPPCESVAQWWPQFRDLPSARGEPIIHAVAGGFGADRVGWAFAAGYQAALHALIRNAPRDRMCAFCVTEAGGNSPKAIQSTLQAHGGGWLLNGAKRWTTLGPHGALFFVAARDADSSAERASIRIACVDARTPGLHVEVMPPTPFVPEVPHAQLQFENAAVDVLLPGDGYAAYVKPFRTVEDIHVNAAIVAYLLREALRLAWPRSWLERAIANLHALQQLAAANVAAPATHLALAGTLAFGAELAGEADDLWARTPRDLAAARWQRDRGVLGVAGQARTARTERAWQSMAR